MRRVRRLYLAPAALGLALVVVSLACRRLGDPDLGWHLATGRSIWSRGGVPEVDDIAFTHAPVRYTVVVSDVLFYLAARASGELGLQILAGLLVAGLGLVLFVHGGRGPVALLLTALALAGLNAWVGLSASLLSYLLLAATLHLLDVHRRHPGERRGRRALAALTPLFFLWANAHGFVAFGAAAALAYAAYRGAARLARGRAPGDLLPSEDGTDVRFAASAVAIAIAAACVNTAGPRLFLGAARFDEELGNVTEWAPTTFTLLLEHEPVALVFVALGLSALALGRPRRMPPLFDAGAIATALVLLFHTTRMIPIAIVVIAPIAAKRLAWIVRPTPMLVLACGSAMLAPGALMLIAPSTSLGVGFEPTILPVAATTWIRDADPAGRMWNFWPFGGHLAWELGPEREVFMDGRNTLARDRALVVRANESIASRQAFEQLAEDFDMQWAVTSAAAHDPTSGAGVGQSRGWSMVYMDDVAAVYVRASGPNAPLAARGYQLVRHPMPPDAMLAIAVSGGAKAASALAHDGALAAEQAPASVRSTFLAACGAIAARDDVRLEAAVTRLTLLRADRSLIDALRQARAQPQ